MSREFPCVPVKEVLYLANDPVDIEAIRSYPIAGVYSFGRGLFARQALTGTETTYKIFHRLHQNDFVLSQLKGWEGALARVSKSFEGWFLSPQFQTFRAIPEKIDIAYFEWYCKQSKIWEELRNKSRGMGARRDTVSPNQFLSLTIPLPPLEEQRRIVARIEELAGKIEEARGVRREAVEEAENLIISELRANFDTLVEKDGIRPLGDLILEANYGTSTKCISERLDNFIPVLRIPNVSSERVNFDNMKYGALSNAELQRVLVKNGDLLIVRTNGSIDLVGRCAVVRNLVEPMAFASYIIKLRFNHQIIDSEYAQIMLKYLRINGKLIDFARTTAGQYNVSLGRLRAAAIPVPSLKIQHQTVAYLNNLQSQIDTLKHRQSQSTAELDALLPSILDRAFKGEL